MCGRHGQVSVHLCLQQTIHPTLLCVVEKMISRYSQLHADRWSLWYGVSSNLKSHRVRSRAVNKYVVWHGLLIHCMGWSAMRMFACRWRRSLIKKVIQQNKHWNDASVSPVIRQSLIHWAYELTEEDFERTRQEL